MSVAAASRPPTTTRPTPVQNSHQMVPKTRDKAADQEAEHDDADGDPGHRAPVERLVMPRAGGRDLAAAALIRPGAGPEVRSHLVRHERRSSPRPPVPRHRGGQAPPRRAELPPLVHIVAGNPAPSASGPPECGPGRARSCVQARHATARTGPALARDTVAGGRAVRVPAAGTGPRSGRAPRAIFPEWALPSRPRGTLGPPRLFSDRQRSAGVHACGSVSLRVSPTMTCDGWQRCATDCRPPGRPFHRPPPRVSGRRVFRLQGSG